jgi:hypothetical protein
VKGAVALFGSSEMALRLTPLVCGVGALALFALLARRFQPAWNAVFATALFAVAPTLIAHAAELKPYSTDVLAAVALTMVAFGLDARARAGPWIGAAVLGVVAVWFSQGAVFVVAGLGGALAFRALVERRLGWRLAALLALWAGSAGLAVASGIHRVPPDMREYLDRFWEPALPGAPLLVFVAVAGVLLWLRDRRMAALLIGPVLVTLFAAAAHLYPFSGRAILFLAPAAILAIAEAADRIVDGLERLGVPRPMAAGIPFLVLVGIVAHDPPVYRNEETRPVLEELARKHRPGDVIDVYYAGQRSFHFYAPRVGLASDGVVKGACHRSDPRAYLRELEALRGKPRVWIYRTHVSDRLAEGPLFDGYLGQLGKRVETIRAKGAEATLWDLSDGSARGDTAETYPLPIRDVALAERFGCDRGPIGNAPWD